MRRFSGLERFKKEEAHMTARQGAQGGFVSLLIDADGCARKLFRGWGFIGG
jgi:hypothetical protein